MELPETLKSKSDAGLEEWFLASLEQDTLPLDHMLVVLRQIGAKGNPEKADEWAELLEENLVERQDGMAMLSLLKAKLGWGQRGEGFSGECRVKARQVFPERLHQVFLDHVGFESELPVAESLRRLTTLLGLKEGVLCHDKTWGFGVVRDVDDFYTRVTVDFDKKRGHEMSFAYAGETLELVDDEHLMARRHREPEALEKLVADDPAEVVRITLRSYGPLSAPDLKDKLVDAVLPEAGWKSFWDAARKTLKADPLVDMPAKRSEPIALRASEKAYDEKWFARLEKESDIDRILALCAELADAVSLPVREPDSRRILVDRLAHAIHGAEGARWDMVGRLLLMAERLGVTGGEGPCLEVSARRAQLQDATLCLPVLHGLPAKEIPDFVTWVASENAEKACSTLIAHLGEMSVSVLNNVMAFLEAQGKQSDCVEWISGVMSAREAPGSIVYWLCRRMDALAAWGVPDVMTLAQCALDALESPASGEELRAQNQIRALVESKAWLSKVMGSTDAAGRQALMARVRDSRGWELSDRRSVMARMIKLYPELAETVKGDASEQDKGETRGRTTSWRSYRQRQADLKKLVEVEIPANSKEIALARSYGDLRENAEYKAAKEHQGILHRRRGEMEMDLQQVRGTDFEGVSTERAGPGTGVVVELADGTRETYNILGEWDRDETLDIISSESLLAKTLAGHGAGDVLQLPGSEGKAKLLEIGAISDEVRAWIAGD